jgi:hypothetical protein
VPRMTDAPAPEALEPAPAGSPWGRRVATVYLVVVGLAFALLVYELARGQRGLGSIAVSVLTAPWSAALAMLAQALAGSLSEGAMRALGFALAAASALLNARILYGMAARAERDARARR